MPNFNVPQYALPTPQAKMFTPQLPYGRLYEEQIRQQAQYLPQIYEAERQRKIQEEQQALEKRALESQRRQYKIGLGIQTGRLATEAKLPQKAYQAIKQRYFTEPYYKAPDITSNWAGKALKESATQQAFGPETYYEPKLGVIPPHELAAGTSYDMGYRPTGLQTTGQGYSYTSPIPAPLESYGIPTTAIGQTIQPTLSQSQLSMLGQQAISPTTEITPSLLSRASSLAKTGAQQALPTFLSYQAAHGLERAGFPEWIEKTGIMGEEEAKYTSNIAGGAAAGALTGLLSGTAIGSAIFPGIGTLGGAIIGGISGLAKSIFG